MPKIFKNLNELFNYVKKQASDVLQKEVAEEVKLNMVEAVHDDVYEAYISPAKKPYIRRGLVGGLADTRNMVVEKINESTIRVRNMTPGNDVYADVSLVYEGPIDRIIVTGTGYTWKHSLIYQKQPFPRDFYAGTIKRLKENKEHISAFEYGLRKRNIETK